MTIENSWEFMSEEEMYDVNGGATVGIYLDITLSLGFVVGVLAGSITSTMIVTSLIMSAVAATAVGGPAAIGIGTTLAGVVGAILARSITAYIVNTIGGSAARELAYEAFMFNLWIPFRQKDVHISITL